MEWTGNLKPFLYRPDIAFLYNYNYDQQHHLGGGGGEMKYGGPETASHMMVQERDDMSGIMCGNNSHERKKRLTSEQLDSLERSFEEEIKLDPERKMKLARELGLQPRQIAVWFQNRRARWKNKQLEHLYDALKQEYDNIYREKQKLQEEVMRLNAILREQGVRKQLSGGCTEAPGGNETIVENTTSTIGIRCPNRPVGHPITGREGIYALNANEGTTPLNLSSSSYWAALPPYP